MSLFLICLLLLDEASDGGTKNRKIAIAFGIGLTCVCLLIIGFGFLLWWRRRHNQQIFFDVNGKLTMKMSFFFLDYEDI